MTEYAFTLYFTKKVLQKRSYLKEEWCIRVIENPIRSETQADGRVRFWGKIDESDGRILRVVTLPDQCTIHNAFFDRKFK